MPCAVETRYGRFRVRHPSLLPAVLECVRTLDRVSGSRAYAERRDCGTGAGGFKPGNKCAGGGDGGGADSGGGSEGGGGDSGGGGDGGADAGGSSGGGSGSIRTKASVVSKRDVAAKEIASEVRSYVERKAAAGYDMSGAPSEEEIAKNWEKLFRAKKVNEGGKPAFSDLDEQRRSRVESAVSALSSNKSFSEFADVHGHPLVIFRRAEEGNSAVAEFRGAIHVYDKGGGYKGADKEWPREVPFEPGSHHNASDYGGYQGLIRHEYGHQLYGLLSREQQKEWVNESVKITRDQKRRELTQYSAENPEELFCEVFAASTEPTAKERLPSWARDMHEKQRQWLLKGGK